MRLREELLVELRTEAAGIKDGKWHLPEVAYQTQSVALQSFVADMVKPVMKELLELLVGLESAGAPPVADHELLGFVAMCRKSNELRRYLNIHASGRSPSSDDHERAVRELKEKLEVLVPLLTAAKVSRAVASMPKAEHEELQQLRTELAEIVAESKKVNEQAHEALTNALVATNGSHFNAASIEHARQSCGWLAASALLSVAFGLAVWWANGYGPPLPESSWHVASNLSYFAPRIVCASLVSYALVVCVRSYRAAKHNEIVNAHRARALATLEKLSSFGTERAREVALLHASSAIFGAQPSGYSEGPAAGNHVAELLDAVQPKAKG